MSVDVSFGRVSGVKVTPHGYNDVDVEVEDVSEDDLLDALDEYELRYIIEHFGADKLLDEIGREEAIDHFDIKEAEEE